MSNSINQQQPEDNYENLTGEEGVKKLKELAEKADICFFCTSIKSNQPFSTRPMSIQEVDDEGNLWFLGANDSNLYKEITTDPSVQLLFQGSAYSDFLNIYGTASASSDKNKIKEFWKPMFKTWFTEGIDDPRISVIKVKPMKTYYWDTKHNMIVGLIKRAAGTVMGKTLDDSIEGEIKVK